MFEKLRVAHKIAASFACVLVVVCGMGGGILHFLKLNGQAAQAAATLAKGLDGLDRVIAAHFDQAYTVRGLVLSNNTDRLKKLYGEGVDTFHATLAETRGYVSAYPDIVQALGEAEKAAEKWRQAVADPVLANAGKPDGRAKALEAAQSPQNAALQLAFRDAATKTRELLVRESEFVDGRYTASRDTLKASLYGGTASAILLAALIGWLLARGIAKPVVDITQAMHRLAAGDINRAIAGTRRADEIGQMAVAAEGFRQAALEKREIEKRAEQARADAERERASREDQATRDACNNQTVVQSLSQGLERLAEGDLSYRIVAAFPTPESDVLRANFNASLDTLSTTMLQVLQKAGAMGSSSGEISGAATELSQRTEQQACNLAETAAAVEEITATVSSTAQRAQQAHAVVERARTNAETSGEVMNRAVSAMCDIERSASEIGTIIGVIDEIAFQTNLLALNAGVEAARAGEAGRGFAVVASEVRALAQRSAEAAKDIKRLICASATQVTAGVALVGDTGTALRAVLTEVAEMSTIMSEIASSAHEQASGLAQVNTAVSQMDHITQQNAAMVEESTAACRSLNQEATQLLDLVGRFKVSDVPGPGALDPNTTIPLTGRRGTARPPYREGSAARILEPECDNWKEF